MKRTIQTMIAAALIFQCSWAQKAYKDQERPIRSAIITLLNDEPIHGYVQALSDSSLAFATEESTLTEENMSGSSYKVFMFYEIYEFRIHGKGTTATGIFIGAVSGTAIGAFIGAADIQFMNWHSYEDPNTTQASTTNSGSEDHLVQDGLIGLGVGSVIGGIIGSASKKKYLIHGNRDFFKAMEKDARLI